MKSKSKFAFAVLLMIIGLAAACTKPSETAGDTTGQDSTAQDTTVVTEPTDTTSTPQDTTAAN
jgi:hypothetical protein